MVSKVRDSPRSIDALLNAWYGRIACLFTCLLALLLTYYYVLAFLPVQSYLLTITCLSAYINVWYQALTFLS